MSPTVDPAGAEVIVIGGGIGGCSAAYHLTLMGLSDVLLLERGSIGCGTTSHSTGNMETYRDDPLIFSMVRYAVESFPRIEAESGQSVGWRNLGRIMYTDREERMELLRTLPELGRIRGIEIELLSPQQVSERLAVIDASGLLGGIWVPSDGRVDPANVAIAYAKAARMRGARVKTQTAVREIVVRDGKVQGVVTADDETLACRAVVVATGLWSRHIAGSCGVELPLYALEHQYIITKPIAGLDRNMPLFLSYDDRLYGREETGGLMVGSFDDDAIPVRAADLPPDFFNAVLNERWDQFEPYLQTAMRRFPVLRTAGVKMLLNGPESFTADGQMLLGPVPGVEGLYCACAFNSNGIALSPAAGKFIAEWVVEGAPSADVSRLDVRRFGPCVSSEAFIRERVTEVPSYYCRIHAAGDDYRTARNIRLSPLHETLTAAGAVFTSVNGWERPVWFRDTGQSVAWLDRVAAETAAASESVLLLDRSTDVKNAVIGSVASNWLIERIAGYRAQPEALAQAVALPDAAGRAQVFGRIMPWQGGWLLTAGPEQEARLADWLRSAAMPESAQVLDVTAGLALLELHGPRARELLCAALGIQALSSIRQSVLQVGAVRAELAFDPVYSSIVLIVPADGAMYVCRRLLAAGAAFGLRPGGFYAEEARRIELGVPRFTQDITPFDHVSAIFAQKPLLAGERLAVLSLGASPRREHRALIGVAAAAAVPGFGSNEVLVAGEQVVGELTSRAWIPGWQETLGLAAVRLDALGSASLAFVAGGQRCALRRRHTSWEKASGGTQ